MSSAVISTTAAQGRFFVLDDEMNPEAASGSIVPDWRHPERSCFGRPPVLSRGHAEHGGAKDLAWIDPNASHLQSAISTRQSQILASVVPASRLEVRPAPEMVSSGITAIDALTGGLPRGCLTEICGPASSGRTTLLLAALAAATQRGEVCAVVDAGDALDPQSAADAGLDLERMLWVRCGKSPSPQNHSPQRHRDAEKKMRSKQYGSFHAERNLEQLLRTADLLLESGGFGLIALDLADLPSQTARRIPLTTWFRFRRAVEHTPTVLLVIERQSIAGSCSSLLIKLGVKKIEADPATKRRQSTAHGASHGSEIRSDEPAPVEQKKPSHAQLLTEIAITAEVERSRLERKPACSAQITFTSKTAWVG